MADTVSFSSRLSAITAAPQTSFTALRMESLIGRFYSLATLFAYFEVLTNALEQKSYLLEVPFWIVLGLNLVAVAALVITNWFGTANPLWYIFHSVVVAASVSFWPLLVSDPARLPEDFVPFVWWTMGWGGLSAGLGFSKSIATIYIALLPALFGFMQGEPAGGSAPSITAIQDGVYTFLISSTLTGLVWFLRTRALSQDMASDLAAEATAAQAAQVAINTERMRVISVVHDQVLSALHAAGTAETQADREQARSMAATAIERLEDLKNEPVSSLSTIRCSAFFPALVELLKTQSNLVTFSKSEDGDLELPLEVANALSQATLQAVKNSLMHAGAGAKRSVSLRASKRGVKIIVVDDGKGFWPARVSKGRLGIRMIIFRGLEQVGAKAHLNSRPREGCQVIMEWSPND